MLRLGDMIENGILHMLPHPKWVKLGMRFESLRRLTDWLHDIQYDERFWWPKPIAKRLSAVRLGITMRGLKDKGLLPVAGLVGIGALALIPGVILQDIQVET